MHSKSLKLDLQEILVEAEELILRLKRMGQSRGIDTLPGMQVPVDRILTRLVQ
jgi:hypothetical protein